MSILAYDFTCGMINKSIIRTSDIVAPDRQMPHSIVLVIHWPPKHACSVSSQRKEHPVVSPFPFRRRAAVSEEKNLDRNCKACMEG